MSDSPLSDELARWQITTLVPGGEGMARLSDGRVGFARGAYPGDVILVRSAQTRRGYLRATAWTLLQAGPERVPSPCPEAGECGGCDWISLSYPAQLQAKRELLLQALVRIAGLRSQLPVPPIVAVGQSEAYRGRIRLHIDTEGQVGLHARGTHRVVPIVECVVCQPDLSSGIEALRAAGSRYPDQLKLYDQAEIRVAPQGVRRALRLIPRPDQSAAWQRSGELRELLRQHFVLAEELPECGQRWPLPGGVQLCAPGAAFTQVNWAANQAMVQHLIAGVLRRKLGSFCDVFAGAGNFSLPLLCHGLSGVAIEANRAAVRAARRVARAAGWCEESFVVGDAAKVVRRLARQKLQLELCVVDPPRSGAAGLVLDLLQLQPRYIVMCSCHPATLARDVASLLECGCELEEVCGFDLFPHTHHLEALVWLRCPGRSADVA